MVGKYMTRYQQARSESVMPVLNRYKSENKFINPMRKLSLSLPNMYGRMDNVRKEDSENVLKDLVIVERYV